MRQFFSGLYGFKLQGFFRAPDYKDGVFLVGTPPLSVKEQSPVMAGFAPGDFQLTFEPFEPPVQRPVLESGYYPYSVAGWIAYSLTGQVKASYWLSIGGNNSGAMHTEVKDSGSYTLNPPGFDGTFKFTDSTS